MKNYFKKFSIMFVMLLSIIGVGAIQNGTVANATTVGERLLQPEEGWQRYSYNSTEITYEGTGWFFDNRYSDNYMQKYETNGAKICFNFTGTKLRILASYWNSFSKSVEVKIDGKIIEEYSLYSLRQNSAPFIVYEKLGLSEGEHSVEIINNTIQYLAINSIDIESTGNLKPYNESISSISLDKSNMDLAVGNSKQLTATTTPAGSEIVWTSSDETIARVDSNGKVTAIKEGTATITAQIKGSEIKATCTVTVTKSGATTPTEPTGDGSLFIEMVDGNIKQAQNLDVADFIKWFKNRDLDDNDNPIYIIKNAKGNAEYLVHDKIVGFEIR